MEGTAAGFRPHLRQSTAGREDRAVLKVHFVVFRGVDGVLAG
jgi:hypothetical protein